jgi:hypothetical protein
MRQDILFELDVNTSATELYVGQTGMAVRDRETGSQQICAVLRSVVQCCAVLCRVSTHKELFDER